MARTEQSYDDAVAAEINRRLGTGPKAVAATLGAPGRTVMLSDAELVERWNLRDPAVGPEHLQQLVSEIVAQGQQEQWTPTRLEAETKAAITDALYPFRRPCYTQGRSDVGEQVKEAQRIARLAQQAQGPTQDANLGAMVAPVAPDTLPPVAGAEMPMPESEVMP